jgi:hypothetical protein
MAKREEFGAYVSCPKCGKSGTACWEENENPVHGDGLARTLVKTPPGFHQVQGELDAAGDPKISCDDCLPESKQAC